MSPGNIVSVSAQQTGEPLIPLQLSWLPSLCWSWTKPFKFWCLSWCNCLQGQQTVECNDSVSVKPIQIILVCSLPFVASWI